MINPQVEIKKAFAILSSLKQNLPTGVQVQEKYVKLFHQEIDRLIGIGFTDLAEFKVPIEEMDHQLTSFNYVTGEDREYSREKYVDRGMLLVKLDAVLSYFELSPGSVEVGFKAE